MRACFIDLKPIDLNDKGIEVKQQNDLTWQMEMVMNEFKMAQDGKISHLVELYVIQEFLASR